MNRAQALADAIQKNPPQIPSCVTNVTLIVNHSADAVSRGVPTRVGAEVEQSLRAVMPLLAAGFCAAETEQVADAQQMSCSVDVAAEGFTLTIDGTSHGAVLPYLLLRMVEAHSQTPAGAYQRLLDMLDGDEEEARAVFKPLTFAADVTSVEMVVKGLGPLQTFDVTTTPVGPRLDPVISAMPDDTERLVFDLPANGYLEDAIEHGFMTLNDLGCFHPIGSAPGDPEIFLRGNQFIVDRWDGQNAHLAEMVRVVSRGKLAGLRVRSEGSDL